MKIADFSYSTKDKPIFEKVDFRFEDNEINFILGPKQSGKTLLLDKIAETSRDEAFIGFPRVEEIAYLSEQNEFLVSLTVAEILEFTNELGTFVPLLLPVEIEKLLSHKFNDLSRCQRKLVLIYLNVILDRELYLFDAPELDLNLDDSKNIFSWFRSLANRDKTVIVTTNRLDNILDTDNVNYLKNSQEVLADSYLKVKSRMAF